MTDGELADAFLRTSAWNETNVAALCRKVRADERERCARLVAYETDGDSPFDGTLARLCDDIRGGKVIP